MAKIPNTDNVKENMEQQELLCCWQKCKMLQLLWKRVPQFLTKLNTLLLYDLLIKLLDIYPKELEACPHKNFHTHVYNCL